MLKLEKQGSSLELRLHSSYQGKKKLIKAFLIAVCCHALFFALFFPSIASESWTPLPAPIIAYVDAPPPEEE